MDPMGSTEQQAIPDHDILHNNASSPSYFLIYNVSKQLGRVSHFNPAELLLTAMHKFTLFFFFSG
jgi:hypothetical protein